MSIIHLAAKLRLRRENPKYKKWYLEEYTGRVWKRFNCNECNGECGYWEDVWRVIGKVSHKALVAASRDKLPPPPPPPSPWRKGSYTFYWLTTKEGKRCLADYQARGLVEESWSAIDWRRGFEEVYG